MNTIAARIGGLTMLAGGLMALMFAVEPAMARERGDGGRNRTYSTRSSGERHDQDRSAGHGRQWSTADRGDRDDRHDGYSQGPSYRWSGNDHGERGERGTRGGNHGYVGPAYGYGWAPYAYYGRPWCGPRYYGGCYSAPVYGYWPSCYPTWGGGLSLNFIFR